jgi:hypothetical protein
VELYLQFGWGMMEMCCSLLKRWESGTVILSPRDLEPEQLEPFASRLDELGGARLLDPQFYLPHSDHERLTSHSYWPNSYDTGQFWAGGQSVECMASLVQLNEELGCARVILPGVFTNTIDAAWASMQATAIANAASLGVDKLNMLATIAMSAEVASDASQVEDLLLTTEGWDIGGAYLILEHPAQQYFVAEPSWVANMLDVIAGLRLQGKRVVVGHANQQMLLCAVAGANAIASGNYMNVRLLDTKKFEAPVEDEMRQRAIWYYCPQTLSEFRLSALDFARDRRRLGLLRPEPRLATAESELLFEAARPSASGFQESASFRHFLDTMHKQCAANDLSEFDSCLTMLRAQVHHADELLAQLRAAGITSEPRSFRHSVEACDSALLALEEDRGAMLRRHWKRLIG